MTFGAGSVTSMAADFAESHRVRHEGEAQRAAIHRLHIGMGDPLAYPLPVQTFFADRTWVHLAGIADNADAMRPAIRRAASSVLRRISPSFRKRKAAEQHRRDVARGAMQRVPFWWDDTSALPFRSGTFHFVMSEHVLEHLFLHEAFALMKDVRRVLTFGGVFRVSVPDADLRPSTSEPIAFHADARRTATHAGRWNDPAVHKTRWNVYSLKLMLELAGFTVVPLRAYDRNGGRIDHWPTRGESAYRDARDWESLCRADYLLRPESLIVDAIACQRMRQ